VILRGEGDFFSAGGDLYVMFFRIGGRGISFSKLGNEFEISSRITGNHDSSDRGRSLRWGLELALSCDLRIASPQAKIGLSEVNLGLIPGWGGMKRLIRVAGTGTARYVALTGKILDGNEAYRLGILSYLVENPVKFSEELAVTLSQNLMDSIKRIKTLIGQDVYSSEKEEMLFGEVLQTQAARITLEKFLKK